MNILFDFKTCQHSIGGASEYVRRVFFSLKQRIEENSIPIKIYGLVDSTINTFPYQDFSIKGLKEYGVIPVDIKGSSLAEIINKYNINKIFIGAGQYWTRYDVDKITCPIICVIHDLCDEEYLDNKLADMERLDSLFDFMTYRLRRMIKPPHRLEGNRNLLETILRNKNSQIITVSEFSKQTILYHYRINEDKIKVLYSPERITVKQTSICNAQLKEIIKSGKKYYILLSANRKKKNAQTAIRAFKKYIDEFHDDCFLVTIGYNQSICDYHIILPYLNESDLAYAIENCYALLFPSFFEGFGYPPIEAMKYGKPVLHSNVTSIPEIVGGGHISFSPFYASDIFAALKKLNVSNYQYYSNVSRERFRIISNRQSEDLKKLLDMIISP